MSGVFTFTNEISDEEGLAWARTELRIRNEENRRVRSEEGAQEIARARNLRVQAARMSRTDARRFLAMAREERDVATARG